MASNNSGHANTASASCESTNKTPDESIVSESCRSIAGPWAEMSTGSHHVCIRKRAVDTTVMTVTTTANSLPIPPLSTAWL